MEIVSSKETYDFIWSVYDYNIDPTYYPYETDSVFNQPQFLKFRTKDPLGIFGERLLTQKGIIIATGEIKDIYRPLENNSLLASFSRVNEENPKSILKFVNHYGLLGFFENATFANIAEPLHYFKEQVVIFKRMGKFYNAIKKEDLNYLAEVLYEKGKGDKSTTLRSAVLELSYYLNERLKNIHPIIQISPERSLNSRFSSQDALTPGYFAESARVFSQLVAGYSCKRLIDAIYLQFYLQVVDPKKTFRRCNKCHCLFFANRKNQDYCSPSCYNAAKQERYRKKAEHRRQCNHRMSELKRLEEKKGEPSKEYQKALKEFENWKEENKSTKERGKK